MDRGQPTTARAVQKAGHRGLTQVYNSVAIGPAHCGRRPATAPTRIRQAGKGNASVHTGTAPASGRAGDGRENQPSGPAPVTATRPQPAGSSTRL